MVGLGCKSMPAALLMVAVACFIAPPSTLLFASSQPTSNEPLPCSWLAKGGVTIIPGNCAPNPEWTLKYTKSTIGKTGSGYAKVKIEAAASLRRCKAIDTNTPEGKAACFANRKDRCFVDLSSGTCSNMQEDNLAAIKLGCPGTPISKYYICGDLFEDECGKNPECVWEPVLFYGSKQAMADSAPLIEAAIGGKLTYGACTPKDLAAKVLTADGDVDNDAMVAWQESVLQPKTDAQFFAANGDCPFAQKQLAQQHYSAGCMELNTLWDEKNPLLMAVKAASNSQTFNITALTECVGRGCAIQPFTAASISSLGKTFETSIDLLRCVADQAVMNNFLMNPEKDGKLLKQYTLCTASSAFFSKELCEGVRIA